MRTSLMLLATSLAVLDASPFSLKSLFSLRHKEAAPKEALPDPEGRCGPGIGSCGPKKCCSQYGWCDVDTDYCSAGCQKAFGRCDGDGKGDRQDDPKKDRSSTRIHTECVEPGTIAITFDDGPFTYTKGLVDQCKEANITAAFFLNGDNYGKANSKEWRQRVKYIYDNDQEIGSHTFNHLDLAEISLTEAKTQMSKLDKVIKGVIGVRPILMRPPFGSTSKESLAALIKDGYKVINWNIDTEDSEDGVERNVDHSIRAYETALKKADPKRDSFIGLQHDPIKETATRLLPRLLPLIKEHNFRVVPLSQCIGHKGSIYRA